MEIQKAQLTIQNLKCHGCAHTITTQLSKLETITEVTIDNETNSVSFSYGNPTAYNAVVEKLSSLGYPIEGETNALHKKTKSFVSCALGRINS